MRPIGFSTGALALSDFRLALEELQGQPVDSVELSALRYRELAPLLSALSTLPLASYKYKSIHAPSSFDAEQEVEIIELLRAFVPGDWPIVLHPDTVHDFSAWRGFGGSSPSRIWTVESRLAGRWKSSMLFLKSSPTRCFVSILAMHGNATPR